MWLINVNSLKLEDFSTKPKPPYAILSHTWQDRETSHQELMLQNSQQMQINDGKIIETCRLAREHGLNYAWVDTCCIDKKSSAELSEAINSMFTWYQQSEICFVYLSDLLPEEDIRTDFGKCRWLTRGWTLQELIAPKRILFFDQNWQYRADKQELIRTLVKWTRIPARILTGRKDLSHYAAASKMSWAASRTTSRIEDIAYSLLGIFDINMPLLYGEGKKAFRRLTEEILKKEYDLSLLCWGLSMKGQTGCQCGDDDHLVEVLAESPKDFIRNAPDLVKYLSPTGELSFTQRGLVLRDDQTKFWLNVHLPDTSAPGDDGGRPFLRIETSTCTYFIPVRIIIPGIFARTCWNPEGIYQEDVVPKQVSELCIITRVTDETYAAAIDARRMSIQIPKSVTCEYVEHISREIFGWDPSHRIFVNRNLSSGDFIGGLILIHRYEYSPSVVNVLIMFENDAQRGTLVHVCKFTYGSGIIQWDAEDLKSYEAPIKKVFDMIMPFRTEALRPQNLYDFESDIPGVGDMVSWTHIFDRSDPFDKRTNYHLSAKLDRKSTKCFGEDIEVYVLRLEKEYRAPPPLTDTENDGM